MSAGHLPNSGIQSHSAGPLFPCFIVVYGNGEARWVDPERRLAGYRLPSSRDATHACTRYIHDREQWRASETLRNEYRQYVEENRP